tara:strand:- start:2165 stop:3064 length:900 start_codon:yes stop_codon:yes gene_type:complete
MSRTQYLKRNIFILLISSLLLSKYIEPNNSLDFKEVLKIYKKDREYSRLTQDGLVYFIQGPAILNIYSRKAFPEESKKDKSYGFNIIIDEDISLNAKHDYRDDPNVYSEKHLGYAYTLAGKDVVNIPKGQHRIELAPLNKKDKIVVRLTTASFKDKNSVSELSPIDHEYINSVILRNKNEKFYLLSNKINDSENIEINKMSFEAVGPTLVRIISRTTFDQDNNEYYQFKIRKDKQLMSTHHMFANISENAQIIGQPSIGVSKWRTTLINVPNGKHKYQLELVSPSDKHVLFKIQEDRKN